MDGRTAMTTHLGTIVAANVSLDKGGPKLARVVMMNEADEAFLFTMPQETATEFALDLSKYTIDRRWMDAGFPLKFIIRG